MELHDRFLEEPQKAFLRKFQEDFLEVSFENPLQKSQRAFLQDFLETPVEELLEKIMGNSFKMSQE